MNMPKGGKSRCSDHSPLILTTEAMPYPNYQAYLWRYQHDCRKLKEDSDRRHRLTSAVFS